MKRLLKPFAAVFALSGAVLPLFAQNVGIGTASPQARLHVAGGARIDAWLATTPTTLAANNSIVLGTAVSALSITPTAGVQTNLVTYTATAYEGQQLVIYNGDGDAASFAGTAIPAGQAVAFAFMAGAWRPLSGGSAPAAWALAGNSGTNPATQFLGTTDAQDLVLRTANTARLRISAAGNVGINEPTPTDRLHLVGSSQNTLRIVDGNQAAGRVLVSTADGSAYWGNSVHEIKTISEFSGVPDYVVQASWIQIFSPGNSSYEIHVYNPGPNAVRFTWAINNGVPTGTTIFSGATYVFTPSPWCRNSDRIEFSAAMFSTTADIRYLSFIGNGMYNGWFRGAVSYDP